MSNESSYTVLPEDGVEISSLEDNFSSDVKGGMSIMEESLHTSVSTENVENDPSKIQSFSFEAQVNNCLVQIVFQTTCFCGGTNFSLTFLIVIYIYFCFYLSIWPVKQRQ